jgi:DNA-binding transcriptional MerR regulator
MGRGTSQGESRSMAGLEVRAAFPGDELARLLGEEDTLMSREYGSAEDEGLLTVAQVAKLTQLAPQTLDALRTRGHGPPSFLAAAGLRYRRAGVEAWIEELLRARARPQARRRSKVPELGTPVEPSLEDRIRAVRQRLARLQARIREQCPGQHEYVQHGDGKLPWCDACGYTDTGLHIGEFGLGHAGLRREED